MLSTGIVEETKAAAARRFSLIFGSRLAIAEPLVDPVVPVNSAGVASP